MFTPVRDLEKALIKSAFFINGHTKICFFGGFFICAFKYSALVAGTLLLILPRSALSAEGSPVMVDYVIDGDTVILEDHRKVRLIGINAPEQDSGKRAAQSYALEARLALQQLVNGKPVWLIEGIESVDRYGRTLAYLELEDGSDVQELMIDRGYAAFVAISPNFGRVTKYVKAEQIARDRSLGIWGLSDYVLNSLSARDQFDGGFAVVNGIVSRVRESDKTYIFDLEFGMSVRVAKQSWRLYWGTALPKSYLSRTVEVRGWFFYHDNVLITVASHPSMIQIL